MAIDVTVSSTDEDLTTTESLREMLPLAPAISQDGYLGRIIQRSSKWAETFVNAGPLTVQTYRETVAGFGGRRLVLSRTPIRAVKAVYRGTDTDEATVIATSEFIVEDRDAGFLARNAGFSWDVPMQWRGAAIAGGDAIPLDPMPLSGQEYKPYLVDYVAGWTYGGIASTASNYSTVAGSTSTGRTLPADVEFAVLLRAQRLYQNRPDVSAESLGDASVSYGGSMARGSMATEEEMTLLPYQRIK